MGFLSRLLGATRASIKALELATRCRAPSASPLPYPSITTAFRLFPCTAANKNYTRIQPNQDPPHPSLVPGLKHWNLGTLVTMEYKASQEPLIRTASPAPLAQDFARQQVSKQQRSNFHSSSIASHVSRTMVSQSVNKTGLHPAGVQ